MPMPWIRVDGDQLVDDSGRPVLLRGFGLGGWMNMENFISGYPGTESQTRAAMRSTLGAEGYARFFDTFLRDFFDEDDAQMLSSLGVNCLRVPFNYRHFEDDDAPFVLREDGFRLLDRVIDICARHGIYTILDLHAAPGGQNHHWHSDNPTHHAFFWVHRHFQDRVVYLWEALAERYRDNPAVAGYNPLNEPADESGEVIGPFYTRLEQAIRAVDPRHVLFLDGNKYSSDFSVFDEPVSNAVYTAHDYALPGIARTSEYPGTTRGEYFDRGVVEQTFLRRTEYMRRTGTPIWVGEFGPIYTGDPVRDASCYQLLRDQLSIYAAHGASWSLWTYKDVGRQGLAYLPADSQYLRQISPSLEQKLRLGTDSWGGSDAHVRHIMQPIEDLFAQEFPDFQPYPWGQRQWIPLLVRNIMLAEPAAERFGQCFEGVSPQRAEELASSFALSSCVVRAELADVLRDHLNAVPSS
ncbi:glycoside hydrolase family 5 protein [Phytoactinopolyspora mesophila]|uniref:Cellulase family glycosylhydrolase n=1 Tax=Phytoactinopolyspora mesophila TaxID=2650750 RepID=A0A7K3M2E7_9ACTN|nr:cellulase family glycosylhydrolase [Phytoactinopolyspora mesophila]NDL57464.1 cellulase family glycosylhydrolase [Phytoactinopolyspora mesophila]